MENKTLEKTLDMAGAVAKVAANITEPKKESPKPSSDKKDSNNQNVIVSLGDKKNPKPVEKHVHTFPEGRALTSLEVDLEMKRAEMDYNLRKTDQQHFIKMDERAWNHQMELERKAEKRAKIRRIIGGILVAIGAAGVGYSIYTDYRDHKGATGTPTALPKENNTGTEGGAK